MTNLNRRDLLTASFAGGIATTLPVNLLPAATAVNDQLQVAVIGLGGMGSHHLRQLLKRGDVRVAMLCDVDAEICSSAADQVKQEAGHQPTRVKDFRRVLDDKTIDMVVVATPHHWHCPIAIPALQAGKDVYLEKPGSHVFREGRLLVEAARKYNGSSSTARRCDPVT